VNARSRVFAVGLDLSAPEQEISLGAGPRHPRNPPLTSKLPSSHSGISLSISVRISESLLVVEHAVAKGWRSSRTAQAVVVGICDRPGISGAAIDQREDAFGKGALDSDGILANRISISIENILGISILYGFYAYLRHSAEVIAAKTLRSLTHSACVQFRATSETTQKQAAMV
jgi:hypothetical protein